MHTCWGFLTTFLLKLKFHKPSSLFTILKTLCKSHNILCFTEISDIVCNTFNDIVSSLTVRMSVLVKLRMITHTVGGFKHIVVLLTVNKNISKQDQGRRELQSSRRVTLSMFLHLQRVCDLQTFVGMCVLGSGAGLTHSMLDGLGQVACCGCS